MWCVCLCVSPFFPGIWEKNSYFYIKNENGKDIFGNKSQHKIVFIHNPDALPPPPVLLLLPPMSSNSRHLVVFHSQLSALSFGLSPLSPLPPFPLDDDYLTVLYAQFKGNYLLLQLFVSYQLMLHYKDLH